MEIEEYYSKLDQLANELETLQVATHEYLENKISEENEEIKDLISFRNGFIDSKDRDKVLGYLPIGFFKQFFGDERVTCFVLTFEIDEIKTKNDWKKRCELYNIDQPLFRLEPTLFQQIRTKANGTQDFELINYSSFEPINDSEIIKASNSYTLIDNALNPIIVAWAKENFKQNHLYIRANPHKVFKEQPTQMLFESILMPANPNWWKKLTIHNRMKEGASYILENCSPNVNKSQFWEFRVKNIRRLEVITKRNNIGNLSMMIEELTSIDSQGLMFGRMIHLDTDSPFGTDFYDSTLNHLDLAINVYIDNDALLREKENLATGDKTIDASYRTHLLRIENIPFKALFGFVISFLESQTLVGEWFEDQFKNKGLEKWWPKAKF